MKTIIALILLGSLVGLAINIRRKHLSQNTFKDLNGTELVLAEMAPKISWCKYLEFADGYGEILDKQFQQTKKVYQLNCDVLKQKFDSGELTYQRYQQTLDATFMVLIDNLKKLCPLIQTLDQNAQSNAKFNDNIETRVKEILKINDECLNKLNDLIVNLSHIKNLTGPDANTSKLLLENLNVLIERAKQY